MLFRECIDIANMELQTLHFIKTEQKGVNVKKVVVNF